MLIYSGKREKKFWSVFRYGKLIKSKTIVYQASLKGRIYAVVFLVLFVVLYYTLMTMHTFANNSFHFI